MTTAEDEQSRGRVPSVDRAVAVLDLVSGSPDGLSLAALTRAVELPKSTVYAVCQTLTSTRLLSRGADGSYRLGPAVIELSAARRQRGASVHRLGMCVPNMENTFFQAEVATASAEALVAGALFETRSADQDVHRQSADIAALVAWGAEVLVLDPVASHGLEDALEEARARGVVVVSVNGATFGADASVVTDNAQAGALVARHLADRLNGHGAVAIVGGTPVTAITDRIEGFRRALADEPGLRIVAIEPGDNSRAAGREAARRLRERPAPVHAIFAINDLTALGVLDGYDDAGATPLVVSVDGSAAAVRQIETGGPLSASAAQDPRLLARTAVRLGLALASGATSGRTLTLPTRLITRDDVPTYEPWEP